MNGKNILKFSLLTLLFLGLVVAWLGFGERGFIHLYQMDRERQTYLEKINALERENRELLDEIREAERMIADRGLSRGEVSTALAGNPAAIEDQE